MLTPCYKSTEVDRRTWLSGCALGNKVFLVFEWFEWPLFCYSRTVHAVMCTFPFVLLTYTIHLLENKRPVNRVRYILYIINDIINSIKTYYLIHEKVIRTCSHSSTNIEFAYCILSRNSLQVFFLINYTQHTHCLSFKLTWIHILIKISKLPLCKIR